MIKEVKNNKQNIMRNMYSIQGNEKAINDNKQAIKELKKGFVPQQVFDATIGRYDKIIHRLIAVLAGVIALLVVSNALWINAWQNADFHAKTTVIKQDGETNTVEAKEMP